MPSCTYLSTQGAEIKPLFNVSNFLQAMPNVNTSHIVGFGHEKRQKEALIDESNDLEWAGTISIGTPAQSF